MIPGEKTAIRTASPSTVLADLVDRLSAQVQAGEAVDWDAVAREHPEHVAELRRLWPALGALDDLSRSGDGCPAELRSDGAAEGLNSLPAALGDYQLIREVGRGGMGIVYEAEQLSLGRRVAVKVLPFAATMDARQLQRFRFEAKAAASLHHPGIVPVYAVGQERGVHYYVMQFVEGQSLAEAIAALRRNDEGRSTNVVGQDGPTTADLGPSTLSVLSSRGIHHSAFFRTVAELGIQAAEALDHAHAQGVVHRDIKPANLMLDHSPRTTHNSPNHQAPSYQAPRLWITDFGLARTAVDAGLTLTGDLIGTLRYMSPEQALAKRVVVDHRTDIYSLGATVYELLTLRRAFDGHDRQELLRQIAFEEPPEPRKLNQSIPAELEIIVQKALEKNPADRYATAQELADDLRRFLEDKPIQARRPSLVQRCRKWARRRRQLAAGLAVAVVVGLVGFATATGILIAKNTALENARTRERASAAAEKAAKLTAEARDAETTVVLKFIEERILAAARPKNQDGGLGFDVQLADALRAALPHVARDFRDQPLIEARLRLTIGTSFWHLGDAKTAIEQFEAARTIYTEHLGPDHADTLTCTNRLAYSYAAAGRTQEALQLREETLARREASLGPDHADTLASMNNLANGYDAAGRHDDALRIREKVLERTKVRLGADHPDTLRGMHNLGNSYSELGRHAAAVTLRAETLTLMEAKFGAHHPNTLACKNNLAESYHAVGRLDEAKTLYEDTMQVAKAKLSPEHPNTLLVMNNLAWLLATAQDARFRDPARAVELAQRAVQSSGNNADYLGTLGTARYRNGEWPQAAVDLEKAIDLRGANEGKKANETFFLAMTHWKLGNKQVAETWFKQGVGWMNASTSRTDELRRFRAEAAKLLGINH